MRPSALHFFVFPSAEEFTPLVLFSSLGSLRIALLRFGTCLSGFPVGRFPLPPFAHSSRFLPMGMDRYFPFLFLDFFSLLPIAIALLGKEDRFPSPSFYLPL